MTAVLIGPGFSVLLPVCTAKETARGRGGARSYFLIRSHFTEMPPGEDWAAISPVLHIPGISLGKGRKKKKLRCVPA